MILHLEEIRKQPTSSLLRSGCIVDTNVLFAANFPLDPFNDWAEEVFRTLNEYEIPIYTNINVRTEFIELNRRVLIPEGLVSFYDQAPFELDGSVEQRLKSLRTRKDKATRENKTFKLSDVEIKDFRRLLSNARCPSGETAWETICKNYLNPYLQGIWEETAEDLQVNFIGTRAIDERVLIESDPTWTGMVDIVGKTGIGTADAMILNLFLHSTLPMVVTADRDLLDSMLTLLPQNRFVLAPH